MTQVHPSEVLTQEGSYERILRQVQGIEGDAEHRIHHDEKRQARDTGSLPHLRDQDVQDWEGQLAFQPMTGRGVPQTPTSGVKPGDGD